MTISENSKSLKKKSTAIFLCLIAFGAFGLHRFYVGKTKSGGSSFSKFSFCGKYWSNLGVI